MSSTVSSEPPNDVAARVEAVARESQAVTAALQKGRNVRLLLLVLLVALCVISVKSYYGLFAKMQEKEQLDAFAKKAEQRLTERSDLFTKEIETLVNHSAPTISKAFAERATKDMPLFLDAAGNQRDQLAENLQKKIEERLIAHHKKLLEKHAKLTNEEYPDIQDAETRDRMMANILVVVDRAAKKYIIQEFETELNELFVKWDHFPIADLPEKGELPLEDQFIGNLIELLQLKLVQSSAPGSLAAQ